MTLPPAQERRAAPGFVDILRRDAVLLAVVAGVAALVRAACLFQLWDTLFPHHLIMDAAGYETWALQIARGNWLGDRVFYQEPLYPYVLAAIHTLFGEGLLAVYLVQAAAGVVNCVLAAVLAARVVQSRWAALIAGLILALYGPMVFYEVQVLKVVWAVLLVLTLSHVLISAWERRSPGLWLLAGVLLALLGLVRGNALLYVPFVLIWLAIVGRHWKGTVLAGTLGLVALGLVLPLGAVCLRNYVVAGEIVLSSSHAGFNFYIGNHDGADGTYQYIRGVREDPMYEGEDARVLASRRAGRDLKLSEASSYWFSEAGKFIAREPGAWLELEVRKLGWFLNAREVQDTWSPDFLAAQVPALRLAFLTYGMLAPAALVGLVILLRGGPRAHLVNLLVLATALGVVVFYVFGRYRMPVVPLFAVLAAAAVVTFVRWVRRGRYVEPLLAVLGATLAAGVTLVQMRSNTSADEYRAAEHHNFGIVCEQAQDLDRAKEAYNSAIALWPRYSRAMSALANLYLKEGNLQTARGLLHEAIQADRQDADAHYLLAGVYYREGKKLNAIVELKAAIAARPGFLEACRDLALIYANDRQYRGAADLFERVTQIDPDAKDTWKDLGECYNQLGDVAGARRAWERALALSGSDAERRAIREKLSKLPQVENP